MSEMYLVDQKMLPDFIEKILKIKEDLASDSSLNVSDACKQEGISRSTFYKYKDLVFKASKNMTCKAILSFKALNETGVLSNVLMLLASYNANIITVNQEMPINNYAFITITLDITNLNVTMDEVINGLKSKKFIRKVELIAFEG